MREFRPRYQPNDAIDFSSLRTVLIYQGKHFGDVLLSIPVLNTLSRLCPGVKVDWVVQKAMHALVAGHDATNTVFDRPRNALQACWLGQRIGVYDLFIDLHASIDAVWFGNFLKSRYSVGVSLSKSRHFRKLTHYPQPNKILGRHTIDTNLDCLRRLGADVIPDDRSVLLPEVKLGDRVESFLANCPEYIVIQPGSRWMFKTPHADFWVKLVNELRDRVDRSIIITGVREGFEGEFSDWLCAKTGCLNLVGETSLMDLIQVIRRADGFIGVDSLAGHIAAATRRKGILLFGPSDERVWGPYPGSCGLQVMSSDVHRCRPCGLDGCGRGKQSDCLNTLSPTLVADAFCERI